MISNSIINIIYVYQNLQEPDVEAGGNSTSKPAGLASMETLDDSNGSTKNSDEKTEDAELENVRLDFNTSEVML